MTTELSPRHRAPDRTYLRDYRPPTYRIPQVDLQFDLQADETHVCSRLSIERVTLDQVPLQLDGEALTLTALYVDEAPLADKYIEMHDRGLLIKGLPDRCKLRIENRIHPTQNTALSGLYLSQNSLFTQCEAEGFRRITYFIDRPDILSIYTVEMSADKKSYPVLLSNGNLVAQENRGGGRHWTKWHDPFPKPSYLFAIVAGDLEYLQDKFKTRSGRDVDLRLYARQGDIAQCQHALESLKQAMHWDEVQYGREYDLDLYMVVAVSDFNMGAMENKGLNIFNTKYVLAQPETATDRDYHNIAGVIGHEYFHNWSGNRVTCRDWFQLSLKEGFTVFRDQQFSADIGSAAVKRIEDAALVRTHQFREDSGPMAHPVRPLSYAEINNFYTLTVYIKGAEVVRMLHTLMGAAGFRLGCDLYFDRHDGEAVTTDDFLTAMTDATATDLTQFSRWYDQVGTPRVTATGRYNAQDKTYTLTLSQVSTKLPGHPSPQPLHIPVQTALLHDDGKPMLARLASDRGTTHQHLLELTETKQDFVFSEVTSEPIPSLLRGFSAPVILDYPLDASALSLLMCHDSDPYCRWDAGQRLARLEILGTLNVLATSGEPMVSESFLRAFSQVLDLESEDLAFQALTLTLPEEAYLAEDFAVIDPVLLHRARAATEHALAQHLEKQLTTKYHSLTTTAPYDRDSHSAGNRALRNVCLTYLMKLESDNVFALATRQFSTADNMTDVLAALSTLASSHAPRREKILSDFFQKWQSYPLVVDKWLRVQATSTRSDTLEKVRELTGHVAYDSGNPNKIYALIGGFGFSNPVNFHQIDGAGYHFLADQVIRLDRSNPQLAARLVGALSHWRRYEPIRQQLMREQLQRVLSAPQVSRDVAEIGTRTLATS